MIWSWNLQVATVGWKNEHETISSQGHIKLKIADWNYDIIQISNHFFAWPIAVGHLRSVFHYPYSFFTRNSVKNIFLFFIDTRTFGRIDSLSSLNLWFWSEWNNLATVVQSKFMKPFMHNSEAPHNYDLMVALISMKNTFHDLP